MLQIPIGCGRGYKGVVDVIEQQLLLWDTYKDSVDYRVLPLSQLSSVTDAPVDVNPVQSRGMLVDQVSVFLSIVNFLNYIMYSICMNCMNCRYVYLCTRYIYTYNSVCLLFVRDSGKNYCTGRHQTLRDYEVQFGKCPPRVKIDHLTVHVERTFDFQFFLRG